MVPHGSRRGLPSSATPWPTYRAAAVQILICAPGAATATFSRCATAFEVWWRQNKSPPACFPWQLCQSRRVLGHAVGELVFIFHFLLQPIEFVLQFFHRFGVGL